MPGPSPLKVREAGEHQLVRRAVALVIVFFRPFGDGDSKHCLQLHMEGWYVFVSRLGTGCFELKCQVVE
jgi:hypothetical protein